MLKEMKLKKKLIILFLSVGIIPLLIIAVISRSVASNALEEAAFNQLSAVQHIKHSQIENFFKERMGDAKVFAELPFIEDAISDLDSLSKEANSNGYNGKRLLDYPPYKASFDKYYTFVQDYMKTYGYFDVFLFSPNSGRILLSVALESDFGTDMKSQSHHLAKGWKDMENSKNPQFIDLAAYSPSNGDPAMFVVEPAFKNSNYIGAIGLQISTEAINKIMQTRDGMGETGETYLVGSDLRMRSDSFLDLNNHSIAASIAGSIAKNGVDTKATKEAFAGRSGNEIITDYNGNSVLSAYETVDLPSDVKWAVIAEIDETEAFASIDTLTLTSVVAGLIIALLVGFLGLTIAKSLAVPIISLADAAKKVAEGDTNIQVNISSRDEIGELGDAFNRMVDKIAMQIGYLDNIPTPIMIVDTEFNIDYMNIKGAEIIGSTQTDLVGKKCYDQFKTGHCNTEKCAVAQAMKTSSIVTEETTASPNGDDIAIMYTGAPVKDKTGKLVGGLEYIADVSEMKDREDYLARSTETILGAMELFAEGNLTASVKAEREGDDIAKLFAGFNQTVGNIKNIILQVKDAVEATASASTQISSSAEEMAAGAQEQSSQTAEVAAAMEEMSRTVVETASNATVSAEASQAASDKANEGSVKLGESKKGMERIVTSTETVGKNITSLASKTEQIGEIAQVIDDIADQTNLLALNAAIEAARAGEHGRGFAVVADEVRKLAENTTKATKEIADTIRGIQAEAKDANISMQEAGEAVEDGLKLNDEVGEVLNAILDNVNNVTSQITQVAAASEEQSATAEQVSTNVEAINNVANESAVGVQQIASASEDLNRLTENLSNLVEQFKLDGNNYAVNNNGNLLTQ